MRLADQVHLAGGHAGVSAEVGHEHHEEGVDLVMVCGGKRGRDQGRGSLGKG